MKRIARRVLLFGLLAAITVTTASAAVTNLLSFDEFGHGIYYTNSVVKQTFAAFLAPDPTGGLEGWDVFMYNLPFLGTLGDVIIRDPAIQGNPIVDVLRFDGNSHVIVYSDSVGGYDSPADTPGPPNPFYGNFIVVNKQHVNVVLAFADFTPLVGGPGYDISNPSYHFLDPGVVPEPSLGVLVLSGVGVFGLAAARQRLGSRGRRTRS